MTSSAVRLGRKTDFIMSPCGACFKSRVHFYAVKDFTYNKPLFYLEFDLYKALAIPATFTTYCFSPYCDNKAGFYDLSDLVC